MSIYDCEYGLWRSNTRNHVYKDLEMHLIRSHSIFHPWGGVTAPGDGYEENLKPVDDLPPATAITRISPVSSGRLLVSGTASENGAVARVVVNGQAARSVRGKFDEWEIELDGATGCKGGVEIRAHSEDVAGNVEKLPHVVRFDFPTDDEPRNPNGGTASR